MARRKRDAERRLIIGVLAALGAGRVTEAPIVSKDAFMAGLQEGNHVWVDPSHAVVDTLIHELIHWLRPSWKESTVRSWTTRCLRTLSESEYREIYRVYRQYARRRKSKVIA